MENVKMEIKTEKKINKNLLTNLLSVPQNKLDKEVIGMILKNIVNRVEKQDLHDESSWIIEEYNQLQHSLDSLYSFIYTPQQSNLSLKDAQVFASYLVQQSKKLKDIVEMINDSKKLKD